MTNWIFGVLVISLEEKIMSIEHFAIEIYIAGPEVDALKQGFDEYGDNPDVVSLFRSDTNDDDGNYNGDGCDRLDFSHGVLIAAIDGLGDGSAAMLTEDCRLVAEKHPNLNYLVVGMQDVGDDEIERCDVLFARGFDASNNPMRRWHGKFYEDLVVSGI